MVMSSLCRKVFQQVELEENLINAFWVEKRLQTMQINGLVKMIQQSRKFDIEYIDGYLPRFKWAFRPIPLDISGCFDIYCLLQQFSSDFPWGTWVEIVDIKDINLFSECITFSVNNYKPLAYTIAMYQGKNSQQLQYHQQVVNSLAIRNLQNFITIPNIAETQIEATIKDEWEKLKKYMKKNTMVEI